MHRIAGTLSIVLWVAWLMGGCASSRSPSDLKPNFAKASAPRGGKAYPNWPMPPSELERRLPTEHFDVNSNEGAGGGTTGARKLKITFPSDGVAINVKWKRIPGDLDGINNAPRKEVAAYAIQPLFLDPEDYVVPTSVARCVPVEVVREYRSSATPTVEGTECVLGLVSVWMKDVTVPDVLYDESRFVTDPHYAYYMANMNLLTYLIGHRDGRSGNFLVSKNDKRRQVFAVDNGISFGPWVYNYFVPNWNSIRVVALRKDSIERLRKLKREDLDYLGVLLHMEVDGDGILKPVKPKRNLDPDDGARRRGTTIQLGLTEDEIENVYERIEHLLEDVDEGKITVF